jgi:hypothetical protein
MLMRVNESPTEHHKAAARHAMAADHHERVAKFWDARGWLKASERSR